MWGCPSVRIQHLVQCQNNQLERKQPMCFFSTSLPSRAARLRFYARKDLRKGWTLDLTERSVSSRGTRASTCHQSKDAKLFLKEILTGQASSLILSGLRQGWSRWSQSWLKTFVCFQIRHWERSQIFGLDYRHFQLQAIFSCETFVWSIAITERNNAACGPTENFFKTSEMYKMGTPNWRYPLYYHIHPN